MARKRKAPKTFREKLDEAFPGFADEADTLNVQQLDKKISDMQKELQDSEQHKAENEDLRSAKFEYDELRGPYTDVKKAVGTKTQYLVKLVREKGGA